MKTPICCSRFGMLALGALLVHSAVGQAQNTKTATAVPIVISKPAEGSPAFSRPTNFAIAAAMDRDSNPNPTKNVILRFDRRSLPPGAWCVKSWTLRLYKENAKDVTAANVKSPASHFQEIFVYPVEFRPGANPVVKDSITWGRISPAGETVELNHEVESAKQCGWLDDQSSLGFKLESNSPDVEYQYYGLVEKCDDANLCNKQPRLIVRYARPEIVAGDSDWPQIRYNPQQTSQTMWRTRPDLQDGDTKPTLKGAYRKELLNPDVTHIASLSFPIMYNDRLMLAMQQNVDPKDGIIEMGAGGQLIWKTPIAGTPKYTPVLDREGNLYVISENCLFVLRAESGQDAEMRTPEAHCKDLTKIIGLSYASLQATPTLGTGGALYLSTAEGLFAVIRDSSWQWRPLWRFGETTGIGTVALNKAESTAYVVDKPSRKLIAINTTNGQQRREATIPTSEAIPVIGPGTQEGESLVYLADSTGLSVFRDNDTASDPWTPVTTIAGSVSQPIVDPAGYVYYLKANQDSNAVLCRMRPDLAKLCIDSAIPIDPATGKPAASTFKLSRSSVLVTDGLGNVYILDPTSSPQNLLKFFSPSNGGSIATGTLYLLGQFNSSDGTFSAQNLILGPDGTLYNAAGKQLYGFRPRALVDTFTLDAKAAIGANQTAFLARNTITVQSTFLITNWSNVILESGDNMVFQPGFRVPLGAQLSCRIQSTLK